MVTVSVGAESSEPPLFGVGPWLVERRSVMEANESGWLDVLVEFDRDEGWAADGQLCCAAWLSWRCGLARSTAYDPLRLAHELSRRPVVHDAFAGAEISYSAARAICSLDDVSTEVDTALVELARSGAVHDVEAAVRYYQALFSQNRGGPYDKPERREIRIWKGHHGLGQLRASLTNDELEAIEAMLRSFSAPRGGDEPFPESPAGPDDQSARAHAEPAGQSPFPETPAEPDDQSARPDAEGPTCPGSWADRRCWGRGPLGGGWDGLPAGHHRPADPPALAVQVGVVRLWPVPNHGRTAQVLWPRPQCRSRSGVSRSRRDAAGGLDGHGQSRH